jgi:hypothetical protein
VFPLEVTITVIPPWQGEGQTVAVVFEFWSTPDRSDPGGVLYYPEYIFAEFNHADDIWVAPYWTLYSPCDSICRNAFPR